MKSPFSTINVQKSKRKATPGEIHLQLRSNFEAIYI